MSSLPLVRYGMHRHKVWWLVGNEVLAAAQFSGYDSNLICSMSHQDRPPPETYHSTFRLETTTALTHSV